MVYIYKMSKTDLQITVSYQLVLASMVNVQPLAFVAIAYF